MQSGAAEAAKHQLLTVREHWRGGLPTGMPLIPVWSRMELRCLSHEGFPP